MFKKLIAIILCLSFTCQQAGLAQAAGPVDMAGFISGIASGSAAKFRPLHLRYLAYDGATDDIKLLLDKGDSNESAAQAESSTQKLMEYFYTGLALPDTTFWVNLRPDAPQDIIDRELGRTDMGRVMLEADLQLKKDTAQFTSPRTREGREYWDKVYKKAEELYGATLTNIPTLTRPWIVPGEIIVREAPGSAYIYKATLKVMLEQDYLKGSSTYSFSDERQRQLNEYASGLVRELIIPKITREINSAKRYAALRQVYYSLILATWFKHAYAGKAGAYAGRIESGDVSKLESKTPWLKSTYFEAYRKSFNEGEYNVRETRSTSFGQTVRNYVSGGIECKAMWSAIQAGMIRVGQMGSAPEQWTRFREFSKTYFKATASPDGGVTGEDMGGKITVARNINIRPKAVTQFKPKADRSLVIWAGKDRIEFQRRADGIIAFNNPSRGTLTEKSGMYKWRGEDGKNTVEIDFAFIGGTLMASSTQPIGVDYADRPLSSDFRAQMVKPIKLGAGESVAVWINDVEMEFTNTEEGLIFARDGLVQRNQRSDGKGGEYESGGIKISYGLVNGQLSLWNKGEIAKVAYQLMARPAYARDLLRHLGRGGDFDGGSVKREKIAQLRGRAEKVLLGAAAEYIPVLIGKIERLEDDLCVRLIDRMLDPAERGVEQILFFIRTFEREGMSQEEISAGIERIDLVTEYVERAEVQKMFVEAGLADAYAQILSVAFIRGPADRREETKKMLFEGGGARQIVWLTNQLEKTEQVNPVIIKNAVHQLDLSRDIKEQTEVELEKVRKRKTHSVSAWGELLSQVKDPRADQMEARYGLVEKVLTKIKADPAAPRKADIEAAVKDLIDFITEPGTADKRAAVFAVVDLLEISYRYRIREITVTYDEIEKLFTFDKENGQAVLVYETAAYVLGAMLSKQPVWDERALAMINTHVGLKRMELRYDGFAKNTASSFAEGLLGGYPAIATLHAPEGFPVKRDIAGAALAGKATLDEMIPEGYALDQEIGNGGVLGRTLVYRSADGKKRIAFKLQKKGEDPGLLDYENQMFEYANKNRDSLGLVSDYPAPHFFDGQRMAKVKDIPAEVKDRLVVAVENSGGFYTFTAYETGSEDYFTYVTDITWPSRFNAAVSRSTHDLFVLARYGIIHTELLGMAHTPDPSRPDSGQYIPDVDIRKPDPVQVSGREGVYYIKNGPGRLHRWIKGATEYANARASGLADLMWEKISALSEEGNSATKHLGRFEGRREKEFYSLSVFNTAHFLNEYLLSAALLIGRNWRENQLFTPGAPQALAKEMKYVFMTSAATYLHWGAADPRLEGLARTVDWERLAGQMALFMAEGEPYSKYLFERPISAQELTELFGDAVVNLPYFSDERQLLPEYHINNRIWSANAQDPDLGPYNGPMPLQELMKATMVFSAFMVAKNNDEAMMAAPQADLARRDGGFADKAITTEFRGGRISVRGRVNADIVSEFVPGKESFIKRIVFLGRKDRANAFRGMTREEITDLVKIGFYGPRDYAPEYSAYRKQRGLRAGHPDAETILARYKDQSLADLLPDCLVVSGDEVMWQTEKGGIAWIPLEKYTALNLALNKIYSHSSYIERADYFVAADFVKTRVTQGLQSTLTDSLGMKDGGVTKEQIFKVLYDNNITGLYIRKGNKYVKLFDWGSYAPADGSNKRVLSYADLPEELPVSVSAGARSLGSGVLDVGTYPSQVRADADRRTIKNFPFYYTGEIVMVGTVMADNNLSGVGDERFLKAIKELQRLESQMDGGTLLDKELVDKKVAEAIIRLEKLWAEQEKLRVPEDVKTQIDMAMKASEAAKARLEGWLKGSAAESFDIETWLQGLISEQNGFAQSYGVEVSIGGIDNGATLEPTASAMVILDDAMRNLLVNAIKYRNQDKASRTVTIHVTKNGGQVRFAVTDNGLGIPERDQDRIFDAAPGADERMTGVGYSSKFGLKGVKNNLGLIPNAGIALEKSVEGEGSTFGMLLPVKAVTTRPLTSKERLANLRHDVANALGGVAFIEIALAKIKQGNQARQVIDDLEKIIEQHYAIIALLQPSQADQAGQEGATDAAENKDGGKAPITDSRTAPETAGGIDFRGLPVTTQKVVSLALDGVSAKAASALDLDKEWARIEKMVNGGLAPSAQRMVEFAAACKVKGGSGAYAEGLIACIAGMMRIEEEKAEPTEAKLRDLLILLEADAASAKENSLRA